MSAIVFPSNLLVKQLTWSQTRLDMAFTSIFGSQSVEVAGPLWDVSLSSNLMNESDSGGWQALLMQLRGQTNQLLLWNIGRPTPLGTMRGTMTLNTAAVQGAAVLSIIEATQATKTLKAGDMLGIGSGITQQVVMVMADATASGGGVISVTVEPPLRNAHLITATVTWDKPKAYFRRKQSTASWDYETVNTSGFTLELIEDWRG